MNDYDARHREGDPLLSSYDDDDQYDAPHAAGTTNKQGTPAPSGGGGGGGGSPLLISGGGSVGSPLQHQPHPQHSEDHAVDFETPSISSLPRVLLMGPRRGGKTSIQVKCDTVQYSSWR